MNQNWTKSKYLNDADRQVFGLTLHVAIRKWLNCDHTLPKDWSTHLDAMLNQQNPNHAYWNS